jgi:hypothetical protein
MMFTALTSTLSSLTIVEAKIEKRVISAAQFEQPPVESGGSNERKFKPPRIFRGGGKG